jgi:hypothetical protein
MYIQYKKYLSFKNETILGDIANGTRLRINHALRPHETESSDNGALLH